MNISLLSAPIRSQLNRRLESGEPDAPILAWLQSLPEAQAMTDASPDAHPVNQDDLSAWKQTGCGDNGPLAGAIQIAQSLAAHVAELRQAVPVPLGDQLALCLGTDLASAWMRPSKSESAPADPIQRAKELGSLVALLRRGDHRAERLQISRQWLQLSTQRHQDHLAAQKNKRDQALQPERHEGGVSKETIDQLNKDLNLF
jgi:hypothetical protein